MKLTARTSRRIAGISLAAAAIIAPATALAAPGAISDLAAPATASRCLSGATEVWLGIPGDGAAGSVYYDVQVSNVGSVTCSFYGYPGVSEINNSGHQVGLPASHSGGRVSVSLTPGDTAHFILQVAVPGAICAHPVTGTQLKVYAPGQFVAHTVPFRTAVCPHRVTMHVDAVHPGTGIPGYTIR